MWMGTGMQIRGRPLAQGSMERRAVSESQQMARRSERQRALGTGLVLGVIMILAVVVVAFIVLGSSSRFVRALSQANEPPSQSSVPNVTRPRAIDVDVAVPGESAPQSLPSLEADGMPAREG
jgi:hypothetical protein